MAACACRCVHFPPAGACNRLQPCCACTAVFKRLVDEVHSGTAPEVLTQAVREGILVNIR